MQKASPANGRHIPNQEKIQGFLSEKRGDAVKLKSPKQGLFVFISELAAGVISPKHVIY